LLHQAYRDALSEDGIEPDPKLLSDSTDAIDTGGEQAARPQRAGDLRVEESDQGRVNVAGQFVIEVV
jgi:hypothetical protein